MKRLDLCDCLLNEDKESLLINLDANIRQEESKIISIQERKEKMILSGDFDFTKIEHLESISRMRYDKIAKIKSLISKIENTKECLLS